MADYAIILGLKSCTRRSSDSEEDRKKFYELVASSTLWDGCRVGKHPGWLLDLASTQTQPAGAEIFYCCWGRLYACRCLSEGSAGESEPAAVAGERRQSDAAGAD